MNLNLNDLLLGPDSERKNPLADRFDKNTRIFVTGGAGSIGRELIFQLVDYGARHVSIFDNSVERMNEVKSLFLRNIQKRFIYSWVMSPPPLT